MKNQIEKVIDQLLEFRNEPSEDIQYAAERVAALFAPQHYKKGLIHIYSQPGGTLWVNVGNWSEVTSSEIRDAAFPIEVSEIANEAGRPSESKYWYNLWH